ncbi:hypothetical protein A9Z42_0070420 [Trichoderma parareesei]|uniref:HIG1 domain-containing protein n=1 Tax=Trichoderma parareesei TaxID=858221 RepID=A0A2H2ZKV3_TRIPA|nr:hypothetical protein A9Z42_0070420 [Trichoderma parareesei]
MATPIPAHDPLKSDEANNAGWEAGKGGLVGAAKWGVGAAILGGAAYFWSPVYRKTTVQFKVYVQMSAMVLGGMIAADQRLRQYEAQVRAQRRWLREKAKWDRYEQEIAQNNNK